MAVDAWDQSMEISKGDSAQMDVGTAEWVVCFLGTSSTTSPIFSADATTNRDGVYTNRIEMETEFLGFVDDPFLLMVYRPTKCSHHKPTGTCLLERETN